MSIVLLLGFFVGTLSGCAAVAGLTHG